jgi:hypothetical protein
VSPEQFISDLNDARLVGEAAARETQDGGTMSSDEVHVAVGKTCVIKRRTKSWDAVCGGYYVRSGMWRGYLISPAGSGVASARLASAEAMAKALRDRGWDASVFYRMD